MHVSVNLKWEPSKESDTAGYKVYMTSTISPYDKVLLISTLPKDATSLVMIFNPRKRKQTMFYISAYDIAGNESPKRLLTTVFVAG